MITKIEIENLTVFDKLAIDLASDLNVFIGRNGTGKTQLLKFIYMTLIPSVKRGDWEQAQLGVWEINNLSKVFFGSKLTHDGIFKLFFDEDTVRSYQIKKNNDLINVDSQFTNSYAEFITNMGNLDVFRRISKKNTFIPTKDMLSHSKGLLEMEEHYEKNMPFDRSHLDIINKARQWKLDKVPPLATTISPVLEDLMDGVVEVHNEVFYIKKRDGKLIPFDHEAEGIKRIGLLWQLLMNGNITEGSVLLWDEPESNINPKLIPVLAEIILELGRSGVQIFVATHDYLLSKYLEVLSSKKDKILYHALYHTTTDGVHCETSEKFEHIINNNLLNAMIKLYDDEVEKVMGCKRR